MTATGPGAAAPAPVEGRARVRRATSEDLPQVARTLREAFAQDPYVAWVTGDRPGAQERYFALSIHEIAYPHGEVYTTEDHAAVALWVPPGRWQLGLWGYLRLLPRALRVVGVSRWPRISRGLALVEGRRPGGPYFLLALVGTLRRARGKGLGRAVLAPVLARCDAEQVAAVLDTCVERNVGFYEQLGFRVIGEAQLPGGPTCWTMWRDPPREPGDGRGSCGGPQPSAPKRLSEKR